VQCPKVFISLITAQVALDGGHLAAEQALDLVQICLEQRCQVRLGNLKWHFGHQFAIEDDLELGF